MRADAQSAGTETGLGRSEPGLGVLGGFRALRFDAGAARNAGMKRRPVS